MMSSLNRRREKFYLF